MIVCKKQIAIFSMIAALISPISSEAAAWLQPKGEGQLINTIQSYSSCEYWDKQGNLQNGPCFYQLTVNPYMEYGVSNKFTFILNPTFLNFSQSGQYSPFALGYATMGGRFSLHKKDYSELSFQILYNQPFKSKNFGGSDQSAQYTIANLQQYADFRLMYGSGGKLDPQESKTWYADVEGSYRPYFEGAADELHIDFLLGLKVLQQRLIFEIQELNTFTLNNPNSSLDPNYNLFTIMPSVSYWFRKNMAVQVGIKQDLYGTNIGKGTAPFIAFWLKF